MQGSTVFDYRYRPHTAVWEVTRACDVGCTHCRIAAQPLRNYLELSTAEARDLIDEIAAMQVQSFVIDGGDPLQRPDVFEIVEYASSLGLATTVMPSAAEHLTRPALERMRDAGVARISLALDGSTAALHDRIRGTEGGFNRTILAAEWARGLRIPLQIHTTVSHANLDDLESIVRLLETLELAAWNVIFPVPRDREDRDFIVTPDEIERLSETLVGVAKMARFDIRTTEGPQYHRYALQRRSGNGSGMTARGLVQKIVEMVPTPRWLDEEKGQIFISHVGEVYPNGYLPLSAGNVRRTPLTQIYIDSPLFRSLRDCSALQGKCGACEYRDICGGSRARAFVWNGDPLAEDPFCGYQPAR